MSTTSCPLHSMAREFPKSHRGVACSRKLRRVNLMQVPELMGLPTLRGAGLVVGIFATFTVALLGFVYLKIRHDLTLQFDRAIALQMEALVALPPGQRLE